MLNWYETAILAIGAVSALSALLAVCLAWRESRLNNSVVVRILECSAGMLMSAYDNNCKPFVEFKVLVRNHGIALHNPEVRLCFTSETTGQFALGLAKRNHAGDVGDAFAKGMVAEFALKSYEFDRRGRSWRQEFVSRDIDGTYLQVNSSGYEAKCFRAGTGWDGLKFGWNRLARAVNSRILRSDPTQPSWLTVPTFLCLQSQVDELLRLLASEDRRWRKENV